MKKHIKLSIIFAALLSFGTAAFANPVENTSSVGIAGFIGGSGSGTISYGGLQYQHWFGDHGLTLEGFTYYLAENNTTPFWYQFNVEYGYKLFEAPVGEHGATRLSLYGTAGNLGWTEINKNTKNQDFYTNLFLSAGFIVDTMFLDHISIPLKFGLCASMPNNMCIGICAGTSLRFSY